MTLQEMIDKADSEPKKIVGNFLLKRLETDIDARNNWERFSKNLEGCWSYIRNKARKLAIGGSCCVTDDQVFQWALEYLMDAKNYDLDGNATSNAVNVTCAERQKAREINESPNAKSSEVEGNRGKSEEISNPKPTKLYTSKPKKKDDTDYEQLTLF